MTQPLLGGNGGQGPQEVPSSQGIVCADARLVDGLVPCCNLVLRPCILPLVRVFLICSWFDAKPDGPVWACGVLSSWVPAGPVGGSS